MAKKKPREEGNGYNFMDTYGDMMTLLFTFFVLMFSMSSLEQEKWELLVKAFTSRGNETTQIVLTPEGDGSDIGENHGHTSSDTADTIDLNTALPETIEQLYQYLKQYSETQRAEAAAKGITSVADSVQIEKTGDNTIFIRFSDNIFFYPDSDQLRPEAVPLIDFVGKALGNVQDKIRLIKISGHTADPNIEGYSVSDRILSTNRANRVLIQLEEKYSIAPKKLTASGYGKNYPIADNSTAEGRSKNRRVEMLIIGNDIDITSQEELYLVIEDALKVPLKDTLDNKGTLPNVNIAENNVYSENIEALKDAEGFEDMA